MTPTLDLDRLVLKHGNHKPPRGGGGGGTAEPPDMCVMEAVAYVAGEPWSDRPTCASPVLTSFLIELNDRWGEEERQLLKPFIPRLVGTRTTDEDEETRRWMIADWLVHEYAPAMFRAVGATDFAEQFEGLAAIASRADWESARSVIREVRDAAYERRYAARKRLAAAVAVAVAVADADAAADAVAVAAADAAAAADADADAAAAAAADADAVAAAAAAAAADAVAAAAAAADAVADADADADAAENELTTKVKEAIAAAATSKAEGGDWWAQYYAAYNVMKPFYKERYKDLFASVGGLHESVLGLIDRLIEVGKAA